MKNIRIPFFVTLALMVMLVSAHLYLVNAQTSTNSRTTSCAEAPKPTVTLDNILKIEITPSNTDNAINKSWLYISPAAKQELTKTVSASKNKDIAFSIYIAGYGWRGATIGLVQSDKNRKGKLIESDNLAFVIDDEITNMLIGYQGISIDYIKHKWVNNFSLQLIR